VSAGSQTTACEQSLNARTLLEFKKDGGEATVRVCRFHHVTMATVLFSKAETASVDTQLNGTSFYMIVYMSMKLRCA
jgi:hypothetical protein